VYISDKAYTREQILQMEGLMLSKLNFQLTTPNALVFLKRFAKVANILATPRTKTELLANYFVELTLQEYKMLKYLPSTVAAAATYLALKTMGQQNPWTPELLQHACYTEAAILPCVRDINALHKNAAGNNLQAVRKKYAQEKHGSVSGIPPASL
jgi:cyclin B